LSATQRTGREFSFNNREVLRSTYECGAALICAVEIQNLSGSVASENADITAVPAGFAIIRGDTLVGYIELEDCILGANILLNKTGSGTVTIPDGSGGTASLVLHEVKTAYSGQWQNGELIKITVTGRFGETTAFWYGWLDRPDTLVLLEENLETNSLRVKAFCSIRELKCISWLARL
jgi:hypothetical protein